MTTTVSSGLRHNDEVGLLSGPPTAMRWQVRLSAKRAGGPASWSPTRPCIERAREAVVTLTADGDAYELNFEVSAPDLALATRSAMARWARLYELCALPDWQLSAITIEHGTGANELLLPTPPRRRRSRPRSPLRRARPAHRPGHRSSAGRGLEVGR